MDDAEEEAVAAEVLTATSDTREDEVAAAEEDELETIRTGSVAQALTSSQSASRRARASRTLVSLPNCGRIQYTGKVGRRLQIYKR